MKTLVVIPTYNERENIASVVGKLLALPVHGLAVCIVDDASPDGTGKTADELHRAHHGRVSVIHREGKLGIGSAYLAGFRYGLEHGYDVICEMDGDGSHDPAELPRLLEALGKDVDVALGSRRVTGGRVKGWGPVRYAMSAGANLFSRLVLGLKSKDVTSGFRCYRRAVIEKLLEHRFVSGGYAFQEEILFKCEKEGFNVVEAPIVFTDRKHGKSKLTWREIVQFFGVMARLRFGKPRHAAYVVFFFALVTAFSFAVSGFKVMDRDFWWHVKAGEIMVATKHLIMTELFAHTREGLPYLANHEWLSQIALYLVMKVGGIDGIIVFRSLMAALTVLIPLFFYRRHLWLTSFMAIWAVNLLRPGLMDRPQLFTFVIFALFITLALRELDASNSPLPEGGSGGVGMRGLQPVVGMRGISPRLWMMVALIAIWVNVHGAAALMGGVTYFAFLCQKMVATRRLPARGYIMAGVLMVAALFMSPHGFGNVTYLKDLLGDETISYIAEWQPRALEEYLPMYGLVWVVALLACIFGGANLVFSAILLGATAFLSLKAVRHEMLFALTSSAIVIYQLNHRTFMRRVHGWLMHRKVLAAAIVLLLTLGAGYWTYARYDAFAKQDNLYGYGVFDLARGAYEFVDHEQITGNMFNTYGIGGYLLYRGYPDRKIFIDGRNVDYGMDLMTHTFAAGINPEVWKGLEEKYDLTYALVDYDAAHDRVKDQYPFSDHLDGNSGWALVYLDDWVGVYLKDTPENHEKIARLRYVLVNPRNLDKHTVTDDTPDGKLEALEAELKRVVASNPDGYKGSLALANLYLREDRVLEARALLLDALRIQPHRAQLYKALASGYRAEEKWAEAAQAYGNMIKEAGDQYPDLNYGFIAEVFEKAGDPKAAARYRSMGTGPIMPPEDPATDGVAQDLLSQIQNAKYDLNEEGVEYAESGDLERAKQSFLDALKTDPGYPEALNNLGAVYQQQKNYQEALTYYKKALESAPDYQDAKTNLANLERLMEAAKSPRK